MSPKGHVADMAAGTMQNMYRTPVFKRQRRYHS